MKIERTSAMPSSDTFDIPAIASIVRRCLSASSASVDPFARNKDWATYTNDLNPQTAAQSHMDAVDFLESLADGMGVSRGFELLEILLVCHGGAHNDTIVIVEKRLPRNRELF